MISRITGKVVDVGTNNVIIDCGGVGYEVYITPTEATALKTAEVLTLWTHLAVREDNMSLFGFKEKAGLEFFKLLITISGIGPKTALGILSIATLDTLYEAISTGEAGLLTKVAGIGRKNAQKIVVELKDKIGEGQYESTGSSTPEIDAIEALKTLGYPERNAREALKQVGKDVTDTGERVKAALKILNS